MAEGLEGGLHGGDRSRARRRLTVAQAADQLGVTVDAVRSRVKRGTIDYVREGGRVYIMLGGDQGATRHDQATDQDTDQPREDATGHRDDLVEELRDRVRALEEANRENRRIIAALTSRIPAIESPEGAGEASDTPEPRSATEGQQEQSSRPQEQRSWWRRWFGFE
jgi:excisionase family DNA binding protein